jgi:Ca-activated chloride channel family protein
MNLMKKMLLASLIGLTLILTGCSEGFNYSQNLSTYYYQQAAAENVEEYQSIVENDFIRTADMPVSTFSADVDTAAYAIIRRKLNDGFLPNKDAVRIEEMLNYFDYQLEGPTEGETIHVTAELSTAPWNEDHQLLMLGLKTQDIVFETSAPSNLVFLLDCSGSMSTDDKLPLLKTAIRLLVDELRPLDRISIVVYAGSAGIIHDGGDNTDKAAIIDAIDSLEAGGSTAGGAGIDLAYQIAEKNFIEGGNNRVILGTDGDFNVGTSTQYGLEQLITEKRESGIFLSVCGFGTGNLKDNKMETLADKGNGVYHYIDSVLEAKKVFAEELGANLVTVAKDVKLQIEFNPLTVKGYRLIGYENRLLSYEDFVDDGTDAGDMGAGHEVIVLYEIIPADSEETIDEKTYEIPEVLKYDGENYSDELLTLSIRYKAPDSDTSVQDDHVILAETFTQTPSGNFLFAASVAEFGLLLRDSIYKYNSSYNQIIARVTPIVGSDDYKAEFLDLVAIAAQLTDISE